MKKLDESNQNIKFNTNSNGAAATSDSEGEEFNLAKLAQLPLEVSSDTLYQSNSNASNNSGLDSTNSILREFRMRSSNQADLS
jgi:hypothetical protein